MKIGDLVKYNIPLRDNESVGVIVEIQEMYRPDRPDCHEDMVVKYRVKWSEDTHPILLRGVNYFAGNRLNHPKASEWVVGTAVLYSCQINIKG